MTAKPDDTDWQPLDDAPPARLTGLTVSSLIVGGLSVGAGLIGFVLPPPWPLRMIGFVLPTGLLAVILGGAALLFAPRDTSGRRSQDVAIWGLLAGLASCLFLSAFLLFLNDARSRPFPEEPALKR